MPENENADENADEIPPDEFYNDGNRSGGDGWETVARYEADGKTYRVQRQQ